MDKSTFVARCMEIKAKISVAKDNLNDFGGYKYRTIEDILAVAKPVLVGTGIELQTDVDVSIIGDKFLVTAYATLTDGENRETTKGLAFYDADHKKMSDEQKLGSASTYAIRYAMTNLLLAGSGEADLDSLPPKDYKGQQTTRTQQAAPTYQAPRQQYQQRPAQAPRQQYQQQAPARQQTAAPQQTASTTPAPAQRQQAATPQQAAATPARQQATAPSVTAPQAAAPQKQQAAPQQATPARQQAPAQSAGRIPMHEIKPGYDLAGNVKDIYKIQPGKEPIYGPYSPQACVFKFDSKGRALRPKACIITREEDEDS